MAKTPLHHYFSSTSNFILPQYSVKLFRKNAAMRQFYLFYKNSFEFVPQLVGQIPLGHTRLIISKIKNIQEALYYSQQAIENSWLRDILAVQIKSKLYEREANAITNFKNTLPEPHSDLANQPLKDPYVFDFMMLKKDAQEHEIEIGLTKHITQFLLELGKGFAFIGRQYEITITKRIIGWQNVEGGISKLQLIKPLRIWVNVQKFKLTTGLRILRVSHWALIKTTVFFGIKLLLKTIKSTNQKLLMALPIMSFP